MSDFINTIDALGDDVVMDSIIDRTITEFKDDTLISVGDYAFANCESLEEVDLPNVFRGNTALEGLGLGGRAFLNCRSLRRVNLGSLNKFISSQGNQFQNCSSLVDVSLPSLTNTSSNMFSGCHSLEQITLPSLTSVAGATFSYCYRLKAVILPNTVVAALGSKVFTNCYHYTGTVNATYNPEGLADGYIYVPNAIIEDYKVATNWSEFASQFRALEDYTVDGTVTGELDETKI